MDDTRYDPTRESCEDEWADRAIICMDEVDEILSEDESERDEESKE